MRLAGVISLQFINKQACVKFEGAVPSRVRDGHGLVGFQEHGDAEEAELQPDGGESQPATRHGTPVQHQLAQDARHVSSVQFKVVSVRSGRPINAVADRF